MPFVNYRGRIYRKTPYSGPLRPGEKRRYNYGKTRFSTANRMLRSSRLSAPSSSSGLVGKVKRSIAKDQEEKMIETPLDSIIKVAQMYVTSTTAVQSGHITDTAHDLPAQGTEENQRVGSRITLTRLYAKFQFWNAADAAGFCGNKIKVHLVQVMSPDPVTTVAMSQVFDYNASVLNIDGVAHADAQFIDNTSFRDHDHNDVYRVLKTMVVDMPVETSTAATNMHQELDFFYDCSSLPPMKISDQTGSDVACNYRLYWLFTAATGNRGTTALTTPLTSVAEQAANTGVSGIYTSRLFFKDP